MKLLRVTSPLGQHIYVAPAGIAAIGPSRLDALPPSMSHCRTEIVLHGSGALLVVETVDEVLDALNGTADALEVLKPRRKNLTR